MKRFKDLAHKIQPVIPKFVGKKIPVTQILNKEIIVYHYKLFPSKFSTKKCIHMQIAFNNTKHVIFTDSIGLITILEQLDPDDFPFIGTIIKDNKFYQFDRTK